MITFAASIALLAVGLSLTLFPQLPLETLTDALTGVLRDFDIRLANEQLAYACLFASPALLVVGSLLPGI
ncbi:hypothetical protein BH20CHL6_BH20CHL6_02370 [soil metagenome]